LLKTTLNTINREQLITSKDPLVVAVSGGPDSMVLLDVLMKLTDNRLIVAHLNHQFRGDDARADADFVRAEANKRGLECVVREIDVPSEMERSGMGAQETARSVRYQFLYEVAREHGAMGVAFGHNADDQAETVLMRIIRGTGMYGLTGIPYKRQHEGLLLIRPLLDVSRAEIMEYIETHGVEYVVDRSNLSTKYFRNLTRLEIMPFLEQYNPQLGTSLRQLALIARDENSFLDDCANSFIEQSVKREGSSILLDVRRFVVLGTALQRRVVHLLLKEYRLRQETTYQSIEDVIKLALQIHPSKSLDLSGLRVYREYHNLVFKRESNEDRDGYSYKLAIPSETYIEEIDKKIRIYTSQKRQQAEDGLEIFDFAKIGAEHITVRSRQPGDRLEPLGLDGSTKLKDLFINRKITLAERERQPVIEDGEEILWLPGIRRSRHALVDENTAVYLYIKLI
jgi:tRNA(Ile)-lysidine synthase